MFLVDMEEGRIIDDTEVKQTVAEQAPTVIVRGNLVNSKDLPASATELLMTSILLTRQQAFGYTLKISFL